MGKCTNLIDRFEISEMANAIAKYTGLDGHIVYFSTKYELKNINSHSLGRIKIYKGTVNLGTISIKKDNNDYVISGFKSKDGKKILSDVIKFVDLNSSILWEYWNTLPESADSSTTMQKFKKVKL